MKFNEPYEGRLNFMYCDVKGLVTTGVGNLIDPVAAALTLPWLRSDMQPASQAEIRAAWQAVKARTDLYLKGGGFFRTVTTLRLTEEAVDGLVFQRLSQMAGYVKKNHPSCDRWPVDAQLAVLSLCWAVGPASEKKFPKFWVAMDRLDFVTAAEECSIVGKGTIVKRNLANKLLLVNAARAIQHGLDPATLYWPRVLPPRADVG